MANVKNPMYFNGYVWKTGAKVSVLDFSTTRYRNSQASNLGIETVVIFLRMNMMNVNKIVDFTHSLILTRILILTGVLTLQLQKVVHSSKKNGTNLQKWLLKLLRRTISFSLMKNNHIYLLSLISDVYGNTIVITLSNLQ